MTAERDFGRRDVTVRVATPEDYPRLRAIQQATLAEPWTELLEVGVKDGPPVALVLCLDDDPIGYTLAIPAGEIAYIAEFAIAPSFQSSGYGSTLMDALLTRLRDGGHETVRLTARTDDERVRSFYEKHGFSVIDTIANHYDSGDGTGLLFELQLESADE